MKQFLSTHLNNQEGRIGELLNNNKTRLSIDLDQLRQSSKEIVNYILNNPLPTISHLTNELRNIIETNRRNDEMGETKKKANTIMDKETSYAVTLEGNMSAHLVTPRGLNARMVNKYIAI